MYKQDQSTIRSGRSRVAALGALALAGLLVAGCGGDEPADARRAATAERPAAELATSALAPGTLEQLKQEYAVLQRDPAPAPTPSPDATPSDVPDRLEEALPGPVLETVEGEATFYADRFEGRRTASGIPFRQNQMVAAHRGYPFGTVLRVTNLRNDRQVTVRVVDRGPHGARAKARNTILDLSRRAAQQLGYIQAGRTPIRVEVLEWGDGVT